MPTVLVDKDAPVGNGDCFTERWRACNQKRIRRKNGFVFFESINPAYEPLIVKEKDIKDLALVRFIPRKLRREMILKRLKRINYSTLTDGVVHGV